MNELDVEVTLGVQDLLCRYAHACDDRRVDDLVALFTDDANFVVNGEVFDGPSGVKVWMERAAQNPAGTHVTVNVVVRAESPDRARSVAAFTFFRRQGGTGPWEIVNIGRYHDTLVRTDVGWQFAAREIVLQ